MGKDEKKDKIKKIYYPLNLVGEYILESNAIEGVYNEQALTTSLEAWGYLKLLDKIDLDVLLKIHRLILLDLNPRIAGKFRNIMVYVGGRKGYPVNVIEHSLKSWASVANFIHLEERIKDSHIWFETIHPFEDGNGRVGRMIMLWQRQKSGLPLEIIHEREKQKYYDWFAGQGRIERYAYKEPANNHLDDK